jgi:hypothetical protein
MGGSDHRDVHTFDGKYKAVDKQTSMSRGKFKPTILDTDGINVRTET